MARRPVKAQRSIANRRAHHQARMAAAATARDRLTAAVDWLRAVIANTPDDEAERLADEAAAYLTRIADRGGRA